MAIFITWKEGYKKFAGRRYVAGGEFDLVFEDVQVTRRARYSNDETDEMIHRAWDYIRQHMADRPGATVEIIDE